MQTKPFVKQRYVFNLGNLFAISFVLCVCYYILLGGADQPLSITYLLTRAKYLAYPWYLLVIALIPIYIGLLIFGTALLGLYCSGKVRLLVKKATHL